MLGASSGNKGTIAYSPQEWRAKNTVKETTEHNQHLLGASSGRGNIAYDPNAVAKTTIKETTEHNQHLLGANSGRGNVAYDPATWKAKNTIKETTENNQHITNINRTGRGNIAYDPATWKAKNTIKETTENNQHLLGASSSNRGSKVYDPKAVAKTTIKELTEHQQHILGASNGNKGTVAYDPVAWEAKSTNRQTTQNTFYVPAGHAYDTEAPRLYDAEYNAQIDECKEIVAMSGRKPTNSNYPKGPIPDMTNYRLKNTINVNRQELPDCRALNSLYRMPVNITKTKMMLPQEERRLDETILSGLDNNPFSIPSYFNNCE